MADAEFPAAIAALPDGGLRYGERLTGKVVEVSATGRSPGTVARVAVSTGGQRGLLGLAVDARDRTFAAWTDPGARIVVAQVAPGPVRTVWSGPRSAERANGGHLVFAPDGRLVVGIGDLLDAERVDDPAAPNGKLLALDPDGPSDQRPVVLSTGWNNPFAFTYAPGGDLWVADNAGRGIERLARGEGAPSKVRALPPDTAPAGLAAPRSDRLLVCGYVSRALLEYEVAGSGIPESEPRTVARDCAIGVVVLADGRIAYANEDSIRVLSP